jgi:hypothetical protein
MPQGGEQSQQKRRTKAQTEGGPEALSLKPKGTERPASTPHTDVYSIDEGMTEPPRSSTSVVSYVPRQTGGQERRTQVTPPPVRRQPGTRNLPQPRQTRAINPPPVSGRGKVHWLVPIGVTLLAGVALWLIGSAALAWGIQRYNDYRYGYPRTFHTDAVVGHDDSAQHPSHFIAVNLNRQAVVYEIKGSDPARSVSYVAPIYIAGDGAELAPVTLEFRDLSGDKKADMIIHIHLPDKEQVSVFINDGKNFRPINNNDNIRYN